MKKSGSDLLYLVKLGIITFLVTLGIMLVFKPSWTVVLTTLLPAPLGNLPKGIVVTTGLASSLVFIFSAWSNPGRVRLGSVSYYVGQSSLEELLFRFNIVLLLRHYGVESIWIVLIVMALQAYLFAVLHSVRAFPKALVAACIYFLATWWYGPIPAMVAHITSNLLLRTIIANRQGGNGRDED